MAANLPRPSSTENVSTTLSSGITDSASSMTVADASNIVSPCYLVIDRVDSSGTLKATSLWEYVKVTNVAGNDLTISRGQNGSTQQSHSSGAIIEAVVTSAMFEDWYSALNPEHTATGGHIMGSATVTNIVITTSFNASGASIVGFNTNTTGGFNALFQVPGSLPTTATDIMGSIPVPLAYTGQFINAYLRTPCSTASLFVTIKKYPSTVYGVISMPAGATFASSASIGTASLVSGDILSGDINTSNAASDLSLIVRAS